MSSWGDLCLNLGRTKRCGWNKKRYLTRIAKRSSNERAEGEPLDGRGDTGRVEGESLEAPWADVPKEGGSPGTARPTMRFFKVVVEVP